MGVAESDDAALAVEIGDPQCRRRVLNHNQFQSQLNELGGKEQGLRARRRRPASTCEAATG
uniref:Uncharacterized protein n=1 Tax=Oryza sativa subsp. japonica TaxID=39947 RepID=Q8H5D0_ORYSJ|nr:hypothetical protein [Oryza sativa Japonica Group]BAD31467.1 hypothetical protein [Oryza sativa Japonica Group]